MRARDRAAIIVTIHWRLRKRLPLLTKLANAKKLIPYTRKEDLYAQLEKA